MIYTLLLGSNLGDRNRYLSAGKDLMEKHGRILGASSIQESKPWGKTNQPDFLNQVILFESDLEPEELLQTIHTVEGALDRERQEKWGPRTLDIDILYAEDLVVDTEDLKIPHPMIADRQFTLALLQEIVPDFVHPVNHMSNAEMLKEYLQDVN
ncbi:MAG: 2-amino-4-hydroxy-6-hydroxymethyldihydropteridine diphosphokinase [Bacteroidetes bacterium]|nr:2-amino-4-hydroxy-6-hydroxymethyldihydropteridine diphosphokinase [Bacteroidota bacterium]